ncbi:hypothetical protein [Lysobacter fragariae]
MQAIGLLFVAIATSACQSSAHRPGPSASSTDGAFAGSWRYASGCENAHGAGFEIRQTGNTADGTWDEGTSVHAENGRFTGELRGRKLFLRFCTERPDAPGKGICPDYRDEDAYVIRRGDHLVWYRAWGSGFRKYIELTQGSPALGNPADCPKSSSGD